MTSADRRITIPVVIPIGRRIVIPVVILVGRRIAVPVVSPAGRRILTPVGRRIPIAASWRIATPATQSQKFFAVSTAH